MKKIITLIGILVLAGVVIFPIMAFSHGSWGGGNHMMGYWGNSSDYMWDRNLTSKQETRVKALDRKFYDDTKELRDRIWSKSQELETVLSGSDPDIDTAKTLQKEISDLRATLDEKTLTHEIEVRKIVPDRRIADNDGWFGHMGSFGHMMGYGQGYCWN